MDPEENSLYYQSFSASYKLENSAPSLCSCDYCLNINPELEKQKNTKEEIHCKKLMCRTLGSIVQTDVTVPVFAQIPEMELLDGDKKLIKKKLGDKENSKEALVLTDNFYDLWQSEKFRAKAFEKDNDKLETRIKYLEQKLEKETQQQIKISLEWRKTVVNLIHENKKLKLVIESLHRQEESNENT